MSRNPLYPRYKCSQYTMRSVCTVFVFVKVEKIFNAEDAAPTDHDSRNHFAGSCASLEILC